MSEANSMNGVEITSIFFPPYFTFSQMPNVGEKIEKVVNFRNIQDSIFLTKNLWWKIENIYTSAYKGSISM